MITFQTGRYRTGVRACFLVSPALLLLRRAGELMGLRFNLRVYRNVFFLVGYNADHGGLKCYITCDRKGGIPSVAGDVQAA